MIASHVVEVHDWETTYKLGKFMAVIVVGFVLFSTCTKKARPMANGGN